MSLTSLLTNTGLILGIIGALMIFFSSPKVSYSITIHKDEEYKNLSEKANHKNKLAKFGALILFIGFLFQLIGYNI